MTELDKARIQATEEQWRRAGRLLYRAEAFGDHPVRPSEIIRQAEKGEN